MSAEPEHNIAPSTPTDQYIAAPSPFMEHNYGGGGISTPRTVPSTPQMNHRYQTTPRSIPKSMGWVSKDALLGTPGRATNMNTPAVQGIQPMSDIVYGFRPEAGWPGILFQVFLQGHPIEQWRKQQDLTWLVLFNGQSTPCAFHELNSNVTLPYIGHKRYVLQCIVPDIGLNGAQCPVTMNVYGAGGKSLAQGLYLGTFTFKHDDCSLRTYEYNNNMVGLMRWLTESVPQDIDNLTNINHAELGQYEPFQTFEIAPVNLQTSNGQPNEFDQDPQSLAVPDEAYHAPNPPPLPFGQMDYTKIEYNQHYASSNEDLQHNVSFNDGLAMNGFNNSETQPFDRNYATMNEQAALHAFGMTPTTRNTPKFISIVEAQRRALLTYSYSDQDLSQHAGQVHNPDLSSPYRTPPRPLHGSPSTREAMPLAHPYGIRSGHGRLHFIKKLEQWEDQDKWTTQELAENRRIIRFSKTVRRNTIILDSEPIPVSEWKEDMISISCIRWAPSPPNELPHKYAGKCVFTSVDIIMLMERLVDYQFMVQEKNRIRRNLEGFKPETVKKEGNTARFFNQVMNYNQPKTRNIEKDIKVFAWSDLGRALKKIIAKYHRNGGIELGTPMFELEKSDSPLQTSSQPMFITDPLPAHPQLQAHHQHSISQPDPFPRALYESQQQHHQFLSTSAPSQPLFRANTSSPFQYPPIPTTRQNLYTPPTDDSITDNEGSSRSSISPQSQVSQLQLGVPFEYQQPFMTNEPSHEEFMKQDYTADGELEEGLEFE